MSRRYITGSAGGKGGREAWIPKNYYQKQTSKYGYYKPEKLKRGVTRFSWVEDKRDEIPTPAAPTPKAAPVAKAPFISFNQEVAQINSQYQAENKRLTDLISSQTKAYNDQASAFDKRFNQQQASFDSSINNLNNRVANASNAYDPTKNMGSSNNINPALSIQEKNKSLSGGTQRYNRNSGLNIKNVSL